MEESLNTDTDLREQRWLHAWHRHGHTVLIGHRMQCAGCGTTLGISTASIPDTPPDSGPMPEWPFGTASCPLCALRTHHASPADLAWRVRLLRTRLLGLTDEHREWRDAVNSYKYFLAVIRDRTSDDYVREYCQAILHGEPRQREQCERELGSRKDHGQ